MLLAFTAVASVIGVGLALMALLIEGTGVAGTPGAILAVIGALATLLGTLILLLGRPGLFVRRTIFGLSLLAAILTALAAWFLMQNILAIVMVVAALGLLFSPFFPSSHRIGAQ